MEALLHFSLVVVVCKSIHETSNGICNDGSVQFESVRAWKFVTIFCSFHIDWSEGKGAEDCKILSGLPIFSTVPVGLEVLHVTLHLFFMESVLSSQRVFDVKMRLEN